MSLKLFSLSITVGQNKQEVWAWQAFQPGQIFDGKAWSLPCSEYLKGNPLSLMVANIILGWNGLYCLCFIDKEKFLMTDSNVIKLFSLSQIVGQNKLGCHA
jgi:hypothetical protein